MQSVMNLDITLPVVFVLVTALMTGVGIEMANNPPTTQRRKWAYRSIFIVLALSLIGVNLWQSVRSGEEQRATEEAGQQAERNTYGELEYLKGQLKSVSTAVGRLAGSSSNPTAVRQLAGAIENLAQGQKPTAQPISAADPYAGVTNQKVGQWAIEESSRIEAMANKCQIEVTQAIQRKNQGIPPRLPDAPGPEFVQVEFRQEFENCCRNTLIKLHDSLVLRLGPPNLNAEEEQDYQEIVSFNDIPQRSWPLCMHLQIYSGQLRSMGKAVSSPH